MGLGSHPLVNAKTERKDCLSLQFVLDFGMIFA